MIKFLLVLLSAVVVTSTWAHIPEYDTIMVRVATNHGTGAYQIQRSIKWIDAGTPYEIIETWTVADGGQVKLSLSGTGRLAGQVQGEMSYSSDGKKNNFVDGLFLSRSSKAIRSNLVRLGLAPRESLDNRPSLGTGAQIRYKPQDFMSLSRVDGIITYAVGPAAKPTVFIEQDQFVLTKLAFPNGPSVTAKGYQNHGGGLYYPKTMTYQWGTQTLEVTTQKVTFLGKRSSEALGLNKTGVPLKLPTTSLITEFYSQFR